MKKELYYKIDEEKVKELNTDRFDERVMIPDYYEAPWYLWLAYTVFCKVADWFFGLSHKFMAKIENYDE